MRRFAESRVLGWVFGFAIGLTHSDPSTTLRELRWLPFDYAQGTPVVALRLRSGNSGGCPSTTLRVLRWLPFDYAQGTAPRFLNPSTTLRELRWLSVVETKSKLSRNLVSRLPCVEWEKKSFKKGLTKLGEFGIVINVERKRCSASSLTQTQDLKFSKLSWCL